MLGDFNDIGNASEQWGSESVNSGNIVRFVHAFNSCNLMDLPIAGPRFSWLRKVGDVTVMRRKLDRVLWNVEAQMYFSEGRAFILTRTHSDHHPIRFTSFAGGGPPTRKNPSDLRPPGCPERTIDRFGSWRGTTRKETS